MKTKMKQLLVIALAFTVAMAACKKKEETDDNEMTTSEDMAFAEGQFDMVFKEVDGNADEAGLKKGYPIVTIDSMVSPQKMVIDYGDTNFLCKDGNYRRGKIIVTWSGRYRDSGTVINISFQNFYQNNNQVEGTKTVVNSGRNNLGYLEFNISVQGKITDSEGKSIIWNSNRTRTWIEGENTKTWLDDKYNISGTTNGVNRNGFSFSTTTTVPLTVDLSCQWRIVSGVVELTPQGKPKRIIDFGNGACDRLATVTVNGKTFNITLRR